MFSYNYFTLLLLAGSVLMLVTATVTMNKVRLGSRSQFAFIMLAFTIGYGVVTAGQFTTYGL
jgi:hypothetical protein